MSEDKKSGFRFGLMSKFVGLVVGVVLICTVSSVLTSVSMSSGRLNDVNADSLQALAYSVCNIAEGICKRDFKADTTAYRITKGSTDVSSELRPLLESLRGETNYDITVFYGDTRYITTIDDTAIGTTCTPEVAEAVLMRGEDYFASKVDINGVAYSGYYTPLHNIDGSIVGMVFAGIPFEITASILWGIFKSISISSTVVCVIVTGYTVFILYTIVSAIRKAVESLRCLTIGDIESVVPKKITTRRDEIGDIARGIEHVRYSLVWIMGSLMKQSNALSSSSMNIDNGTSEIVKNMEHIDTAMDGIAKGATSMASELVSASDQTEHMGQCVQEMQCSNNQLTHDAEDMRMHSNESKQLLNDLTSINDNVSKAVESIYNQTLATNKSVEDINIAVNVINDIAEETNLLSLNATIEAARAGESGRGFSVVATQIQKLAEQSNQSAREIIKIINKLKAESAEAVTTMKGVKVVVDEQSGTVTAVADKFDKLLEIINDLAANIEVLTRNVATVDSSKDDVVLITQSLTAVAQQNAASTEETSAAISEVTSTLFGMKARIEELDQVACSLRLFVSKFNYSEVEAERVYNAQMKSLQ